MMDGRGIALLLTFWAVLAWPVPPAPPVGAAYHGIDAPIIRPAQLRFEDDPGWPAKIALVGAFLVFSGLYFRLFRPPRPNPAPPSPLPREEAAGWVERLEQELKALEVFDYRKDRQVGILRFDAILREYLSRRWRIAADRLTSPEVLALGRKLTLPKEELDRLGTLTDQNDLIKFSQAEPRPADWEHLFLLMRNALAEAGRSEAQSP